VRACLTTDLPRMLRGDAPAAVPGRKASCPVSALTAASGE